jgi:hypothetical protein
VVAVLTILSGVRLMHIASGGFTAEWFHSGSGHTYAIGGALSIVGFLGGMFFARPLMMRTASMLAARASAPADQQAALDSAIGAVRRRAGIANATVSWMLITSAALMAVARYL